MDAWHRRDVLALSHLFVTVMLNAVGEYLDAPDERDAILARTHTQLYMIVVGIAGYR
jgi:hypothetical protein